MEGEGREVAAEVVFDVEGEHAEEDMGADAVVAEVADGSESEVVFGLEGQRRTRCGRDAVRYTALRRGMLGGEAGADDIEAVEGGFSGDGVLVPLEGEVALLDVGEEVLAHLAPVEDAGGGDGDGFGFSEGSGLPLGALLEFFELGFGGAEERFALSGAFGGDAGFVADDEALAGEEELWISASSCGRRGRLESACPTRVLIWSDRSAEPSRRWGGSGSPRGCGRR